MVCEGFWDPIIVRAGNSKGVSQTMQFCRGAESWPRPNGRLLGFGRKKPGGGRNYSRDGPQLFQAGVAIILGVAIIRGVGIKNSVFSDEGLSLVNTPDVLTYMTLYTAVPCWGHIE